MSHRQFVDDDGSVWAVWDVYPSRIWESLSTSATGMTTRVRTGPLHQALAAGWLCFESGERKLRLAPIPASWDALATADLAELRKSATAVHRSAKSD
jgi:hypothetical protein